jgi:hypothetical protein
MKETVQYPQRMPSSGMFRRVFLVRTDVSEERIASIIRVTRIAELGTTLAITSNGSILQFTSGFVQSPKWKKTMFQKLDQFPSSGNGMETCTLFGYLESD